MDKGKEYQDLQALLAEDTLAYQYFSELPQYIREMISDRGGNIHTDEEMRRYADNLLSGDK